MRYDEFHIGKMRQSGTLRQNFPISNSSGGEGDNYSDIVTTRGWLQKDSGAINLLTGQITLSKNYTWHCRFQSDIANQIAAISPTDLTWLINGKEYPLQDYELVDEIPHLYKFNLVKDE